MYIVLEIQKSSDGTIAIPPVASFSSFFEAAARYHSILSAAAVSQVAVQSCAMLDDTGLEMRHDTFNHVDGQIEDA